MSSTGPAALPLHSDDTGPCNVTRTLYTKLQMAVKCLQLGQDTSEVLVCSVKICVKLIWYFTPVNQWDTFDTDFTFEPQVKTHILCFKKLCITWSIYYYNDLSEQEYAIPVFDLELLQNCHHVRTMTNFKVCLLHISKIYFFVLGPTYSWYLLWTYEPYR